MALPMRAVAVLVHFHDRKRSSRIVGIEEVDHDGFELLELDGLGDVRVEADFGALGVDVAEDVGRQSDHGSRWIRVLPFPFADFAAGLVAVFVGHVKIALCGMVNICDWAVATAG